MRIQAIPLSSFFPLARVFAAIYLYQTGSAPVLCLLVLFGLFLPLIGLHLLIQTPLVPPSFFVADPFRYTWLMGWFFLILPLGTVLGFDAFSYRYFKMIFGFQNYYGLTHRQFQTLFFFGWGMYGLFQTLKGFPHIGLLGFLPIIHPFFKKYGFFLGLLIIPLFIHSTTESYLFPFFLFSLFPSPKFPLFSFKKRSIFYDSNCSFCRKCIQLIDSVDLFKQLRFLTLSDAPKKIKESSKQNTDRYQTWVLSSETQIWTGWEAVLQLCYRIPLLWVGVPIVFLLKQIFRERIYETIKLKRSFLNLFLETPTLQKSTFLFWVFLVLICLSLSGHFMETLNIGNFPRPLLFLKWMFPFFI